MNIIHRILQSLLPPPPGSRELANAMTAVQPSTERLRERLDRDPCASDPTRRKCRGEVARALRDARRLTHE